MNSNTRDCQVTGYGGLIPSPELPDLTDRHVLAAAIVGRCDVIVTQDLKDFPDEALAPYGIDVQHPDEFLCSHLNLARDYFATPSRKSGAAELRPFAELL